MDTVKNGRALIGINESNFGELGLSEAEFDAVKSRHEWLEIRHRRDALLRACDYAVMPDYPLTEDQLAEVKAYRQALRDIPETAGDPAAVEWPAKPEVLA